MTFLAYLLCCGIGGYLLGVAYKHEEPEFTLRFFLRSCALSICLHYLFHVAGWMT